jgi:hypothetical protein
VYQKQGRIAEALFESTKARDIMAALVAISPANSAWKKELEQLDQQIANLRGQATPQ